MTYSIYTQDMNESNRVLAIIGPFRTITSAEKYIKRNNMNKIMNIWTGIRENRNPTKCETEKNWK